MGRYDGISDVANSISSLKLSKSTGALTGSLRALDGASATQSAGLLTALGNAFAKIDANSLKKIFKQIPDELGGKILNDIPQKNAVGILKKLPDEDAGKFLSKMKNAEAENLLKKLPDDQATGIAKKMGKTWNIDTKTLLVGGALTGAAFFLNEKIKDAEKKIKNCIDVCEPDNWDSHANGSLEKSKLNYSEIKGTRDQPICTDKIDDCGEYCKTKCTEEHEYEPPLKPLVDDTTKDVKDTLTTFFKNLNPFNKDGIFGDSGWMSMVSSAILVFAIIMFFVLKNQ